MRGLFFGLLMLAATGMASAAGDCLILGDSIAVGVSGVLAKDKSLQCETIAKVGRPTSEVLSHAPLSIDAKTVIISTGSNDHQSRPYQYNNLRNRIYGNVTWLLPAKNLDARAAITQIATHRGDRVIDLATLPSHDGIHPTLNGYRTVAQELRTSMQGRRVAQTPPLLVISYALSSVGRNR